MKRILSGLLLAVILLVLVATPILAIALPDNTPEVLETYVYRNLLETGDRLFLFYGNVPYAVIPATTFNNAFIWQLIDTDGVTVLGSTVGWPYVFSGYGYQVFSMYFPAASAITWNPTPAYKLRLLGNPMEFTPTPIYDFTINATSYSAFTDPTAAREQLTSDLFELAAFIDTEWSLTTSLLSEDETGLSLSTFGQVYFGGAIYNLRTLAPNSYLIGAHDVTLVDRTWTDDYQTDLNTQYVGTWVDTAKAAGGTLFGTSYDLLSLIIVLVMLFGVIIANIYLSSDHWAGLIDAAFILVISSKLGMIELGYVALICAICLIYTGTRIFGVLRG